MRNALIVFFFVVRLHCTLHHSIHREDMQELHVELPTLLKPGGIYSYFNGLCPRNKFFAAVYRCAS